mmetsp:Transcript_76012/g.152727  ORF Transcript_76012/g.152727 Transcript_76012/m.152727 type:complete len:361 (-) Transcript_76012:8-1090(-)
MSRSDDTTATEADATPALNNTNDQLVTASASGVSDTETATLETGISPGSQIKPLCNMTTPATNVTIPVLDKEVAAIPVMKEGNYLLFTAEKHPDLDLTAFVGVAKISECIATEGSPIPVSQITTLFNKVKVGQFVYIVTSIVYYNGSVKLVCANGLEVAEVSLSSTQLFITPSMREKGVTRQQGIDATQAYSKWEQNRLAIVDDNKKAKSGSGRPVRGSSVGGSDPVTEDARGGGNAELPSEVLVPGAPPAAPDTSKKRTAAGKKSEPTTDRKNAKVPKMSTLDEIGSLKHSRKLFERTLSKEKIAGAYNEIVAATGGRSSKDQASPNITATRSLVAAHFGVTLGKEDTGRIRSTQNWKL